MSEEQRFGWWKNVTAYLRSHGRLKSLLQTEQLKRRVLTWLSSTYSDSGVEVSDTIAESLFGLRSETGQGPTSDALAL